VMLEPPALGRRQSSGKSSLNRTSSYTYSFRNNRGQSPAGAPLLPLAWSLWAIGWCRRGVVQGEPEERCDRDGEQVCAGNVRSGGGHLPA
jgi:hypothetical protein